MTWNLPPWFFFPENQRAMWQNNLSRNAPCDFTHNGYKQETAQLLFTGWIIKQAVRTLQRNKPNRKERRSGCITAFAQRVVQRGRRETEKGSIKWQGDKWEVGLVGHGQGVIRDIVEIGESQQTLSLSQKSNDSQAGGSLQPIPWRKSTDQGHAFLQLLTGLCRRSS